MRDRLSTVWTDDGRWWAALGAPEWEALLGQARRAWLLARLAQHLVDRGAMPEVPAGPRRHLESALRIAGRQRDEVRWEVDCIRRALASVETPIVLLKGAAYVAAGLPPARGRLFADVDLLVDRRRLPAVESALLAAGWIGQERDAYNDRYYRRWMHELPPMRHVQRGTQIDVHHAITAPTSAFQVDPARLLAELRPIDAHANLWMLQPVDLVLHSAVHLFQDSEFDHGLRDLLDLNDLLVHFGEREPQFWPRLVERARALGLAGPLHHALFHGERLFGTRPPPEVRDAVATLRPAGVRRATVDRLLAVALRPMHPSCRTRWDGAARWALYVRAHWLRMPAHLLLPHLARKAWMRRRAAGAVTVPAPRPRGG